MNRCLKGSILGAKHLNAWLIYPHISIYPYNIRSECHWKHLLVWSHVDVTHKWICRCYKLHQKKLVTGNNSNSNTFNCALFVPQIGLVKWCGNNELNLEIVAIVVHTREMFREKDWSVLVYFTDTYSERYSRETSTWLCYSSRGTREGGSLAFVILNCPQCRCNFKLLTQTISTISLIKTS